MGFKRLMFRATGIGWIVDARKNIKKKKSFTKGIKQTFKEDICEDAPIISSIYRVGKNEGHAEGKIEGYILASEIYEKKFKKLTEDFLSKEKNIKSHMAEYDMLLDNYEREIERLQNINAKTKEENELLNLLLKKQNELQNLAA